MRVRFLPQISVVESIMGYGSLAGYADHRYGILLLRENNSLRILLSSFAFLGVPLPFCSDHFAPYLWESPWLCSWAHHFDEGIDWDPKCSGLKLREYLCIHNGNLIDSHMDFVGNLVVKRWKHFLSPALWRGPLLISVQISPASENSTMIWHLR